MTNLGLITREIAAQTDTVTVIREVWDLTVPGCPMRAIRLSSFGIERNAKTLERMYAVPAAAQSNP